MDRLKLFNKRDKKEQGNGVNLVIDYHPALRGLYGIFKELQSMVNCSADLGKITLKGPLIRYQRPKNLKDHLVRAKLREMEDVVAGMYKCGGERYKVCDSIASQKTRHPSGLFPSWSV